MTEPGQRVPVAANLIKATEILEGFCARSGLDVGMLLRKGRHFSLTLHLPEMEQAM